MMIYVDDYNDLSLNEFNKGINCSNIAILTNG